MQPPSSLPAFGLTRRAYQAASRVMGITLQNMTLQDWVVSAFHLFMWARVMAAPDSPDAIVARRFTLALLTVSVSTILLTRGEILRPGWVRALAYRVGLFAPMVLSYISLRWLLPALHPRLLDMQLWAMDEALFGFSPAIWMARFNVRPIVEWFSFFYYSYFYILAVVLLPTLFFDRGERQRELLASAMLVASIGHPLYTFVPGLGPYATLAFDEALRGGFFYGLILDTVDQAGAMLDIFPSLHTAYPVMFALFAFSRRRESPYRYVWPILAFFAVNMVIATMFLRWHWAVDVVAGLALAVGSHRLGRAIALAEAGRSEDWDPRQPTWEPLWPRRSRS
ncbi:MAG: phosphatase PAP2 family protein [Myxococcota bacterium]